MSLIEEALRKIKDPLLPQPPPGIPASPPPPAHSWVAEAPAQGLSPTPRRLNPLLAVAAAIAALTAVLTFWGAFWMARAIGRSPAASVPASPAAASSAPEPAPTPRPVPELHGVVEGVGEPYAVINGAIVGVGDRIEDLTVRRVEDGTVTLRRDDGEELVLRVKR